MSFISTKGNYGLLAMVALSKNYNKNLLQIKDISDEYNIPKNYLEQILVILKKKSLLSSKRGYNGGYQLNKNPKDITVFEILNSLESCMHYSSRVSNQILDSFWIDVHSQIKDSLSLSLHELEGFLKNDNTNIMYHI